MFESPVFWLTLIPSAAFCAALPKDRVRWRATILAVLSIWVIGNLLGFASKPLCVLLLAGGWVVAGACLTHTQQTGVRTLTFALTLAPLVTLWLLGKEAVAFDLPHLRFLYVLGISYFVVKTWTLLKDLRDQQIEHADPFIIFAYLFFFPTFVAGPMHLFAEFDRSVRTPSTLDNESLIRSLFRITLGLAKVTLLAPLFLPLSMNSIKNVASTPVTTLVIACAAYSIVIWSDFSGYSDIAIGAARLLGVHTPENFQRPYLAVNIRDFWQRWHISFSRVLTSYLFVPLSRFVQPFLGDHRKAMMIIAYLTTFLFVGFWHGPTLNFVIWGLHHGLGLIVYDLYRPWAVRWRRRNHPSRPSITKLRGAASVALTLAYVSAGWIFFVLPIDKILGYTP